MKTYFIVTIDTECDNQWDDYFVNNISLNNLKEIPSLQKLFGELKVRPCYLVTYPVIKDNSASAMFKELLAGGLCEVGIHLHTWTTPPVSESEVKNKTFLHSLPAGIQKAKFDNLHNAISDTLKSEPKSYRGGKYSFDAHMLRMLEEKRYMLDTSVTPFNNWSTIGGPDFTDCITRPYFPSKTDVLKEGDSAVLEVPVSIDFDRDIPDRLKKLILRLPLRFHAQGILKRMSLCKIIWLDPSFQALPEMKRLIDSIIAKGKTQCINLMFHSSVLLAGGSPYNATKEDVCSFYCKLESVLFYMLNDKHIENIMPKDFAMLYKGLGGKYAHDAKRGYKGFF